MMVMLEKKWESSVEFHHDDGKEEVKEEEEKKNLQHYNISIPKKEPRYKKCYSLEPTTIL